MSVTATHANVIEAGKQEPRALVWPVGEGEFHPRRVVRLKHSMSDHPLLQLKALGRLAEKFEAQGNGQVKFVRSGTKSGDPLELFSKSDRGLSVADVFARIEEPGSWVSLYNVQSDPEYRAMIHDVINSTSAWRERTDPGWFEADGFIFVSSPPSATPFHIDRENNLFLQIHGRKRQSVWDPGDRQVVPEIEIEHKIGRGRVSKVLFENSFFERAIVNEELGPGEGVYMPSTAGHTTNTEARPRGPDDTYSISIGIVFYTTATRRAAYAYALNDYLRKVGLKPRPPYESPMRDALKYPMARSVVLAKRLLRGFAIPPGM